MDRYGCLKDMNQFSDVCSASPVNNQILFLNGNGSHFKTLTLIQMKCKNIQPFVLKSGDSINDHTKNNVPNFKLKYLYNVEKSVWMLKYGAKHISTHHMNSVSVEACDSFKVFARNIVREIFLKTNLHPLRPPDFTTNTKAWDPPIKLSSGDKAEEINNISRHTFKPI